MPHDAAPIAHRTRRGRGPPPCRVRGPRSRMQLEQLPDDCLLQILEMLPSICKYAQLHLLPTPTCSKHKSHTAAHACMTCNTMVLQHPSLQHFVAGHMTQYLPIPSIALTRNTSSWRRMHMVRTRPARWPRNSEAVLMHSPSAVSKWAFPSEVDVPLCVGVRGSLFLELSSSD